MKINFNIPKELLKQLEGYGVHKNEIVFCALADINTDCEYADCYVLLTKEKLILAATAPDNRVRLFGGYSAVSTSVEREWATVIKSISDIEKLDIEPLVAGGVLYSSENGTEHRLTAFSGLYMGEFRQLIKIFNTLRNNEELTEEDLSNEKEQEVCPKCGSLFPDRSRKVCPKCMDRRSIFKRMLSYFKPHSGKIFIMMLCHLATAAINLLWPYLNGTVLYDKVFSKDEAFLEFVGIPAGRFIVLLGIIVIAMIITRLSSQFFGTIQGVMTAKIVPNVVKNIKNTVFNAMGKLSLGFFSSRQTGGLMTRVLYDANYISGFFIDFLPYFIVNAFTLISTIIVMFAIDWKMAIVSIVLLPFLSIISVKLLPRLWHFYGKRYRASRSLNSQINDNLTGARVVKAFGQEEKEISRFDKYNKRMREAELSLVGYDNRFHALYTAVQNLATFAVWGFGSVLVLSGSGMQIGMLMTFVGYVAQLNGPLDFMSRNFRNWAESTNSAQRIFEIIDAVPDVDEVKDPTPMPNIRGEIELNNVTFGYDPNKPVLKNINLDINAGELLGVVGRSGAGKSTLVSLISRLYDPQEGEILIDGVNVKNMSFKDLRSSIAMVSQETYIFMGTVAANIAYGNPDASHEDIVSAAIAASAHDFICKMSDGYDTVIGSSGRSLSGGERQRISIARAILANPKILILDEATASMDTETERAIQRSLDRLVKGRTTISIAHRLSTLANANRLAVIDDGKLTEFGTHEELMQLEGTYYKLVELQSKALAVGGLSGEDNEYDN